MTGLLIGAGCLVLWLLGHVVAARHRQRKSVHPPRYVSDGRD